MIEIYRIHKNPAALLVMWLSSFQTGFPPAKYHTLNRDEQMMPFPNF